MGFVKAMDDLPWILKVILALPGLDLVWAIYRIVKGVVKGNTVTLIAGIVWLLVGGWTICWIVDLIFTILNKPLLFAD
ncbi:MAG: hypothetical protein IJ706_01625 [Clostridia bacterium]|nr:hypothetical protein [Clostridia bacterium]